MTFEEASKEILRNAEILRRNAIVLNDDYFIGNNLESITEDLKYAGEILIDFSTVATNIKYRVRGFVLDVEVQPGFRNVKLWCTKCNDLLEINLSYITDCRVILE